MIYAAGDFHGDFFAHFSKIFIFLFYLENKPA